VEHQSDNVGVSSTVIFILDSWVTMLDSIEPGGVRTEWNKGNMIRVPTHPAYTGADAPSTTFRPLINTEYTGDPMKGDIFTIILSNFVLTKSVHL